MHLNRSGSSIPADVTKQDTLTSAWCHPSRSTIFFFPPVLPWAPFSSFHLWVQIPIYEQELEQCFTAMIAPGNHHRRCRLSLEEVPPHVDMSADQ